MFGEDFSDPFFHFYFLSVFLISVGFCSLLQRQKTLIHSLLALEVILGGLALLYITTSLTANLPQGLNMVFVLLTLGGSESALGLALVIKYFGYTRTIAIETFRDLRG